VKDAIRPLRELYGHTVAAEFDSVALETVQEHLARSGRLARTTINARVNRVRRMFKWAVRKKLIPAAVLQEVQLVPGLRRDRCEAPEAPGVPPVPVARVEATLPHLPGPVAAMAKRQLLTGCRPLHRRHSL
jgi:hypothetical protein